MAEITKLSSVPKAAQYFVKDKTENIEHDAIDLSISQCQFCGHIQSVNNPVSYFKDVITAASLSEKLWQSRKAKLVQLSKYIATNSNPRLLEIGASKGQNLQRIIDELGWEALGIENNLNSVNYAKSLGLPILHAYIEPNEQQLPPSLLDIEKFDIIIIYNFLEHMPRPANVLKLLHQLLKEKGVVYATVPSLDFILETNCIHEFVADHLSYFTKDTLEYAFKYAHYDVLQSSQINNNNDLEITAQKRDISSAAGLISTKRFTAFIESINLAISDATSAGHIVIFWGAGHRSLTLISQLQFDQISYVVDSAKFKQGLYTPVSRIPIIAPEKLYSLRQTVSLFLSLPGIYAEEVAASVSKNGKHVKEVYTLEANTYKLSN